MKVAFIIHGFVQGVGYRWFVKKAADALGVRGMVENNEDGSVLVAAESDPDTLEKFEASINVSTEHGIQVMKIDKLLENDPKFPKISYDAEKFRIKK